jgi:hypothetical protein
MLYSHEWNTPIAIFSTMRKQRGMVPTNRAWRWHIDCG